MLAVTAATWAVLMALAPALQIRTIVARRSSHGVSIGYFVVLFVGFALWAAYGISIKNVVIVVPNSLACLTAVATIVIAFRFR